MERSHFLGPRPRPVTGKLWFQVNAPCWRQQWMNRLWLTNGGHPVRPKSDARSCHVSLVVLHVFTVLYFFCVDHGSKMRRTANSAQQPATVLVFWASADSQVCHASWLNLPGLWSPWVGHGRPINVYILLRVMVSVEPVNLWMLRVVHHFRTPQIQSCCRTYVI